MATCNSSTEHGLPAGPSGIPFLGAALKLKGPETNLAWTKQYGPIYSVRIGPNQLVYMNTIELVEEYMERKGAAFLGRPLGPAALANGLLFGKGDRWRENRSAFKRAVWRASTTETYEAIIHGEADRFLSQLAAHGPGQPVEVDTLLLPAFTSRLVTLLLGESLPLECEDMNVMLQQMRNLEEVDLTSKSMQMFLKVKRFRRPLEAVSGRTIPDMFKMAEAMQGVIRGWIKRRRAAIIQAGGQANPAALLDQLLLSPEYVARNEEFDKELIQSVMDMFNGGVTSTLSAFEFAVLFLMHNPRVLEKVKAEVDQAAADGHPISWANRAHYPYTHATLVEILRLGSVTPSSLPHVSTEDVMINDQYEIPADVFVLASIYSLHRDPRFYKNPEEFLPERHLDGEGRVVMPRSYRPFGIGERLCMGYHLAEVEMFLFMARMVSAFRVRAEDPANPPLFDTQMRVVRRLKPFACVFEHWEKP